MQGQTEGKSTDRIDIWGNYLPDIGMLFWKVTRFGSCRSVYRLSRCF